MALTGYADKSGKVIYQDSNQAAPSWYSPGSDGVKSTNSAPSGSYSVKDNAYHSSGGTASVPLQPLQPLQPQQPQFNVQDQINQLTASQQAASAASLGKARDSSLSQLGADRSKIEPTYYAARNQASTQNQLGARNLSEYLANRGQTNSGVSSQGAIASNVALQGQYGSLKTSQLGEEAENTRAVQNVNSGYESDMVASKANIQSQALQAAINQYNSDRSFGLEESNATGMYNGVQTIGGRTADANIASSNASTNLNVAQLQEIQNPNSVTNQLAKIGLDTAKLNYAALPDQLKAQAQGIAQDLQMGKISLQQAQINLNYLPKQMELGIAQTQAQINASNRSNTGSSGSSGGTQTAAQQKASATADFYDWANSAMSQNMPEQDAIAYAYANSGELARNGTSIKDAIAYITSIYTQVRNPARAAAGGYQPM